MAVRAERMQAEAEARKQGIPVCDLQRIKEFTVTLGDPRKSKDALGKERIVRLLRCHAKVDGGIGEIDREVEMVAQENYGVLGEIRQCLNPALKEFLDLMENAVTGELRQQAAPADPRTPRPLPSYGGKDPVKVARMQAMNAERAAKKAQAEQSQPAAQQAPQQSQVEALEGGES